MKDEKPVTIYYVIRDGELKYWSWNEDLINLFIDIVGHDNLKIKSQRGLKSELVEQFVKGGNGKMFQEGSEVVLAHFDTYDDKGKIVKAYAPVLKNDYDLMFMDIDSYKAESIDYSTLYQYMPHVNRTYTKAFKAIKLDKVLDFIIHQELHEDENGKTKLPKIDQLKFYADYMAKGTIIDNAEFI